MRYSTESACKYAIEQAKKKKASDVSADHLLLGCLRTISQFGIAQLGPWSFDLEELGIDWLAIGEAKAYRVAYAQEVVDLLDLAAKIASANGSDSVSVVDVLAAFAGREDGLFGKLKGRHSITSAQWRTALAALALRTEEQVTVSAVVSSGPAAGRDYLTPEEVAEMLAIHVQTVRAHVRSGKLPALRLAGERAIRIRRSDVEKVFEPAEQAR